MFLKGNFLIKPYVFLFLFCLVSCSGGDDMDKKRPIVL